MATEKFGQQELIKNSDTTNSIMKECKVYEE